MPSVDLRRGDLIVAIDGERTPRSSGAVTESVLRDVPRGSTVERTVLRRGEERSVRVEAR